MKRPSEGANEGKSPALGDEQARKLLDAPPADTIKGKRDRAILAVFLYHGLRCAELVSLCVRDIEERRGVKMLKIKGKGSKLRYIPAHPAALERIDDYLGHAGHGEEEDGPLFRPVKNNATGDLTKPLSSTGVYQMVKRWASKAGVHVTGFCNHALRSTAATNALEHEADIAKVQEWLGHSNIGCLNQVNEVEWPMTTFADVQRKALTLQEDDRLTLARELLESCESEPSADIEQAWDTEIKGRMDEVEAGTAEGRAATEVLAEIDRKFGWEA